MLVAVAGTLGTQADGAAADHRGRAFLIWQYLQVLHKKVSAVNMQVGTFTAALPSN